MKNSNTAIIKGMKLGQSGSKMEIRVLGVIRGEETRSTISVWGGNGADCLAATENIAEGEVFVFALQQLQEVTSTSEWEVGDYLLSICGVNYVSCESFLNANDQIENLGDCLPNPCNCTSRQVDAFPNPTYGPIQLQLSDFEKMNGGIVNVYTITGQKVRSSPYVEGETMSLAGLDRGIYLVELANKNSCNQRVAKVLLH